MSEPASPPPPVPLLTAEGAFDCAANAERSGVCEGAFGCVSNYIDGCRAAENACESVVPRTVEYPGHYTPPGSDLWPVGEVVTFQGAAPCASVDASCAYDPHTQLCEPFTAVSACPATAEEAAETRVLCTHPDQPQLQCDYEGVRYECGAPWRAVSGARPPPEVLDRPVTWFATPDYDDAGCPLTERARQAPCEPLPQGECIARDNRFSCPNGTWESVPLPPPP